MDDFQEMMPVSPFPAMYGTMGGTVEAIGKWSAVALEWRDGFTMDSEEGLAYLTRHDDTTLNIIDGWVLAVERLKVRTARHVSSEPFIQFSKPAYLPTPVTPRRERRVGTFAPPGRLRCCGVWFSPSPTA